MTGSDDVQLDAVDAQLLALLQADGRATTAQLARAVSMSSSATADRVRRLTDAGVITGYRAQVDPARVGYPVRAFVRVRLAVGAGGGFTAAVRDVEQVLAAHHVTGEDCYLLEVVAASMEELEDVAARLALFGHVTTNIVFSSAVRPRAVPVRTRSR